MKARSLTLSVAGALVFAGAALDAQQPGRIAGERLELATAAPPQPLHGTWTRGPGTYTVTICDEGCTIRGTPGQSIPLVFEAWGGGGGGASGSQFTTAGGGGGGGGYDKYTTQMIVHPSGTTTYTVTVGSGGAGGTMAHGYTTQAGGAGGASQITTTGYATVTAAGGGGGSGNNGGGGGGIPFAQGGIARPGAPGGTGADPNTCNGGGGGGGGMGGGPEALTTGSAINSGGNGGHGSYQHRIIPGKSCTAHGQGWGRTNGSAGGNGRVRITW